LAEQEYSVLKRQPNTGKRFSPTLRPGEPGAWAIHLIGALLIVGLMVAYYATVWDSLDDFVIAIDHCEKLFCDFTNHYYPMGRSLFWTRLPVPGYFYTPFFALFLVPFGAVPLRAALWLWGVLQALLMVALIAVPGRAFLKRSPAGFYLYVFLVVASLPILHNLKWGQVSVLMTLCALAALILHQEDRPIAAGILLALATWIKYYTGIFALIFILKKDTKLLLAFVAAGLVMGLILPLGILGGRQGVRFYREVNRAMAEADAWVPNDINSQFMAHVIRRLVGGDSTEFDLGPITIMGYLVVALNIALVAIMMRVNVPRWEAYAYLLLFASLPFILSTSWPHYFVYLPFCHALLAGRLLTEAARPGWLRVLEGTLLTGSVVLSSAFLFNALGDRFIYSGLGLLFFSNLLVLVSAYLALGPQLLANLPRRQRQSG
jgi:hypothetical protein